jgi:transcriptional regulator with XRE-family HTH domain
MTLGEAIRRLREERLLTQAEFSSLVGVTRETISTWENGAALSLRNAGRLIDLGLDPAYVLPTASVAPGARADLSSRGAA